MRQGAEEALQFAKERSSGTRSLAWLRKNDHPYAKRHPSPLLDLGEINEQSGRFKAAWENPIFTFAGVASSASIANNSPVANFLKFGTRTMHRRPIEEETAEYARERTERAIEDALKRRA